MKSTNLLCWWLSVATLLAACLFPTLALGQNDVWLGGSGYWGDPSGWSAGVPNSGSDAFIDNGNGVVSAVTVTYETATCNNLTVDSDDGLFLIHFSGHTGRLVINGTFTNFSGGTLTGGSYKLSGGGTLVFNDAHIVTNAAKIHLGILWNILDQYGNDALRDLSSNASQGTIILDYRSDLGTSGAFSNAGKLVMRSSSTFTVGTTYTQTAGSTFIRAGSNLATLKAPSGVNIQGGKVSGGGVIVGNVTSSGSVTPLNTLSLRGTYTQTSKGSLNITVGCCGGNTQLAVPFGKVSLNGTLNINSGVPPIGTILTILTGSAVTGQFSTVNGLSINGSEHFEIAYNSTSVTLTVVAGP